MSSTSPLQHVYRADSGAYNITGPTMHGIRAKLARLINNEVDVHIACLTDSTFGGYGGAAYAYDTNPLRGMARSLASKLGVPWQQGIQWAVGDKAKTADNWALTGSFGTGTTLGTGTTFLFGNGVGTAIRSALPLETGTAVDIYYSDLSSNGVTWKIDGVSQTVLPTGGTNTVRKVTVTGLANTAHTIEVDLVAGKNISIFGTRVYTPATKALHVHNLSIGGSRANGGANDLNWSSVSNSGVYGVGWTVPNTLTAAGITPDFLIVSIGGNDIANGTDAPTTLTGMDTMFGYYPTTPGMIVHAHKVSTVTDAAYNPLSAGKYQHADSLGKAMFNWDDFVQGVATATADGLIGADGTHPGPALQTMIGRQLARIIWPG